MIMIMHMTCVSNILKHSINTIRIIVIAVMNRQINMRIIIIQSIRI